MPRRSRLASPAFPITLCAQRTRLQSILKQFNETPFAAAPKTPSIVRQTRGGGAYAYWDCPGAMIRFALLKIGGFVATVLVAAAIIFFALDVLPGDPARFMLGIS